MGNNMVNKRKVRLMARTAMYEKHEGKRELKNVMYYRSDYIGMLLLEQVIEGWKGLIGTGVRPHVPSLGHGV